jgi:Ca2+-transporting ATPase
MQGGPPPQLAPPPATTGFLHVPGDSSRGNSLDNHSQGSSELSTLVPPNNGEVNQEDKGDILAPDQTNFHEYEVENNPFAFSPGLLSKLLHPKSITALKAMGGIDGLAAGLATDLEAGLSVDETTVPDDIPTFETLTNREKPSLAAFAAAERPAIITGPVKNNPNGLYVDRLRVFKDNRLPERKSKSLFRLMWIALMDKVLLLLSGAAVISLALGLYQTFGVKHDPNQGASVDWVEGVAIIVAIVIVVSVGAGNDWQKERQFVKLNKKVCSFRRFNTFYLC